ncbi:MAG: threonine ammonia-lyase [Bdellovibrionales bacterium]
MKVSFEDIQKARERLKSVAQLTPADQSTSASQIAGSEIYFKFENTQKTGSFKIRGAYNKISQLSAAEKSRGVVASSAGNHAQGVALSARLMGVPSTIVMPVTAPLAKVTATRHYGAEVVLHGEIYDEAFEKAKELEREKGLLFIPPYEDPHVIAGQGTLGLELYEQIPNLDTVVVPIGGGGLISGIGIALKTLNPKIRVIGVQSSQAPGMYDLFHQLSVTSVPRRISTIADGIAIKKPSKVMYENFISKYVDEIVTVSDDDIAGAIVFLLERAKTVAEGSGAAGWAAVMNRSLKLGKTTGVLLCGGNIDLNIVSKIIERGQIKRGRLVQLSVIVEDIPGQLYQLTRILAEQKANIMQVHHDRVSSGLFLRETRIDFVLETSSHEHVELIKAAIQKAGARLV